MSLRSLIVDDEPLARRRLRTLLRAEPDVEIIGEAEDGPSAIRAVRDRRPELLFLDVQMPGVDGFEVLEEIGPANAPGVIFVTAYDRYALKAFDAHAIDYLLKPFDRTRLHEAVKRAVKLAADDAVQERLRTLLAEVTSSRPLRRLMVRSSGRIYFVGVEEIAWIDAAGHYVELHVIGHRQTHIVRDTIGNLESRLDPAQFARISRSTIVRLAEVRELQPASHGDLDVLLKSGQRLRATRGFGEALRRALV